MTKPPSAAELASDYIRTLVFSGVLRTGDKVPVDEIADVLEISRQPVREALIELANDGLVETDRRRGTFVAGFGPDTIADHYELYSLLAGFAVRRVAERRDPVVLARLREIEAVQRGLPEGAERARVLVELFRTINHAAGNTRLRLVMRSMSRFTPGEYYLSNIPDTARRDRDQLRELLVAIEAGDADLAASLSVEMWTRIGEMLIAHLSESGVFVVDRSTLATSKG